MSYQNLKAEEVAAFLQQPGAIALDIRDYQSYEAGHLLGAEHANAYCMSRIFSKRQQKSPVLVYCYHGIMSRDFAQLVHKLGFEQVYHLEGGYNSWARLASV